MKTATQKPTGLFSQINFTLLALLFLMGGSLLLEGCQGGDSGSSGGDHSTHQHSH